MPSVLLFSRFHPGKLHSGRAARLAAILDGLHQQHLQVHFVALTDSSEPKHSPRTLPASLASFHQLQIQGSCTPGPLPAAWRHLARPHPVTHLWSWTGCNPLETDLTGPLAKLLDQTQASLVWIDHSELAPLLIHLPQSRRLLKIVDTHGLQHERDAALSAAALPAEFGLTASEEHDLLDRSDILIAMQNRHRELLQHLLPRKRVVTLGHAVETNPQPCLEPDLCFVGSKHRVNELGLLAFLERAWPAIRAQCPASCLEIVGTIGQCPSVIAAARRDRRLILRGTIDDTAAIYRGPAAVICPLWLGVSLQTRLAEALAHGKATIASPLAAQGLEDAANRAFLLAQEPEDFVQPVVELLKRDSSRQNLEAAAHRYARGHFSPASAWAEVRQIFAEYLGDPLLRRAA